MLLTLLAQKPNIFAYRTHVGMSMWLGIQAKRSKKKKTNLSKCISVREHPYVNNTLLRKFQPQTLISNLWWKKILIWKDVTFIPFRITQNCRQSSMLNGIHIHIQVMWQYCYGKKINGPRIEMKILKLNSYLTWITAYQKNDFFTHYKQACRFKQILFSLYRNVLNVHGI